MKAEQVYLPLYIHISISIYTYTCYVCHLGVMWHPGNLDAGDVLEARLRSTPTRRATQALQQHTQLCGTCMGR